MNDKNNLKSTTSIGKDEPLPGPRGHTGPQGFCGTEEIYSKLDKTKVLFEIDNVEEGLILVYNRNTGIKTWSHSNLSHSEIKRVIKDGLNGMRDQNMNRRKK